MLKQIGVRLEEDLIKQLKMEAAAKGESIQEIVTYALESYFNGPTTPIMEKTKKLQPIIEPVKEPVQFIPDSEGPEPGLVNVYTPPTYPNPLDDDPDYIDENKYYILRKTAKVGKPVKDYYQYQYRSLFWMVLDGCRMHFDKNGDVIPFRFTDEKGKVVEPDESELKEIEEAFGKPVIIEK